MDKNSTLAFPVRFKPNKPANHTDKHSAPQEKLPALMTHVENAGKFHGPFGYCLLSPLQSVFYSAINVHYIMLTEFPW